MKPIIFSTPMVKAILEGKKTMTRRVFQNVLKKHIGYRNQIAGLHDETMVPVSEKEFFEVHSPYHPGDILWVRETWRCGGMSIAGGEEILDIQYKADGEWKHIDVVDLKQSLYYASKARWKPSIHMRREAARLFLEVKAVRVERLQDMNNEDAVAEGAVKNPHYIRYGGENCLAIHGRYKKEFAKLWDNLNAKRGYGWDSNPWVWVIEFERIDEETAKRGINDVG